MKPLFLTFIALFCFFTVQGAEPSPAPYDVIHYDAELSVNFPGQSLTGKEEIRLQSRVANLTDLYFDAGSIVVSKVWANGVAQQFEKTDGRLKVHLARPLPKGEVQTLAFAYLATPRRGVQFFPDNIYAAYWTSEWLVCNMHPGDKATFSFKLTVPARMKVVANGDLRARHSTGEDRTEYTWQQHTPIPAYVYGFAAGEFQERVERKGALTLRTLARSYTPEQQKTIFGETASMIEFYEQRAGVPYRGSTYTQVLAPGNVAQEMDRFTVVRESYAKEILNDPLEDWLIAHELSHQWWGNNVTCADWSDFWLNEGMATFMTAAYKEKRWGRDEYDREIELSRRSYQHLRDAHKDRPLAYEHPIAESAAGGSIVYDKGALMLHLLRCYVGEKAFWEGIRQYTQKNFGGSVTSRNLQSAMETTSGKSLASFFDKWIYSASPPSLVARHRIDNGELIVEVEQQQPDPWPVPIKVAVETKSGRQTKQLLLTTKRGELRFRIVDAPLSVRIDDGGFLPFTVSHERPVTMLFYQLGHEPDLAGRIEAMDRLKELTSKAPEVRQQFRAALRERTEKDSSRLVRTLAQKEL